jgi:hypothetical protein
MNAVVKKVKAAPRGAFWMTYSVLRVVEGGMGQKAAYDAAQRAGATIVRRWDSPYIGHIAIRVFAGKRVHVRIQKALFGRRA